MNILEEGAGLLTGLEQLQAFLKAGIQPPIAKAMGFGLIEIGSGFAGLESEPDERVYNPLGSVHGG